MTNTKMLEAKIAESGYKRSYLAKMVGLTAFGLANKINNVTEFKTSEIEGLCKLLKIDSLREKEAIFFAKSVDLKSTNRRKKNENNDFT